MRSFDKSALREAGIYCLLGLAWIVLSETALLLLLPDFRPGYWLNLGRGSAFILLASLALYFAIARPARPAGDAPAALAADTRKLLLVFAALAAVVVLAAIASTAYYADRRQGRESARLDALARLQAGHVATWLAERRKDIEILGDDDMLPQLYRRWRQGGDAASRNRLFERLRHYRDTYGYLNVALLDAGGRVVAGDADAPHAGRAAGILDLQAPLGLAADQPPQERMSLLLQIDLQGLLLPGLPAGLMDDGDIEIALVRRLGEEVLYLGQASERAAPSTLRLPLARRDEIAVRVVEGRTDANGIATGSDRRGEPALALGRPIAGADGWFVLASARRDDIDRRAGQTVAWVALTAVLALMVAAIVAVLIHQRRELQHSLLQRRQQEEKMEALKLLEAITEGSQDAIFAKDADGRYLFVNRAALHLLKRERAAVIGRTDEELFPPAIAAKVMAADRRVMLEDRLASLEELDFPGPDGSITLLTTKGPLHDAAGRMVGVFGIGRDISARKRVEGRLSGLVASAQEGIVTVDRDQRIVLFNPAAEAIFGYPAEAVLQSPLATLAFSRTDDGSPFDPWQAKLPPGTIQTLWGRRQDGRRIVLAASVSRHGSGGEAAQTLMLRDITGQLATERRLRQLSAAAEQSPVSIVITDTGGNIEYANPRFTQITGYALDEVLGRNPRLLKSGHQAPELYEDLWKTISGGGEWSGELINRRKNGENYWAFLRIVPVVSEQGALINYLAVQEDITLYKEREKRRHQQQERMLHTARLVSMGEIAATLAHELNQPLAAIANFCGVAEQRLGGPATDPGAVLEAVRLAGSQAVRAGEIVRRIRAFVKKDEARREACQIEAVIASTVRLLEVVQRDWPCRFHLDFADGLPAVRIDRIQIEQVLFNLIRNGIEAMESGSDTPRLDIFAHLAEDADGIAIEVRDYGCGLPSVSMDLFAPFNTTKPQGMGMGLAISQSIVAAHGGRLWAEGNARGTSFFFTIPIAKETPHE